MAVQEQVIGMFDRLDGVAVPAGWYPSIANTLAILWASVSEEDRAILHPLGRFLEQHSLRLAQMRAGGGSARTLPVGVRETNPVVSSILLYRADSQVPGLTGLLLILIAAAVEQGYDAPLPGRKKLERLASIVRGALEDADSPLRLILGDAGSLPKMAASIDANLQAPGENLHESFAHAWRTWVRGLLTRWCLADPTLISAALRPHALVVDDAAPEIEAGGDDPDDQSILISVQSEAADSERDELSRSARRSRAIAYGLTRGSAGSLFTPADQLIPVELIGRLARAAIASCRMALAQGDAEGVEGSAALALAMATGIRELDLHHVIWGTQAKGKVVAIDPDRPVLLRAVCRPPQAAMPGPHMAEWFKPSADQIRWPLPPELHALVRRLAPDEALRSGQQVLSGWGLPGGRNRLWGVSRELCPELELSPSVVRQVLAAELTRQFGPEVAQLALGDTFSVSPAPPHYCAQTDTAVARAVHELQVKWFGQSAAVPSSVPAPIGSRLILTDEAARRWPEGLRASMRSAAHRRDAADVTQWAAHRDHLAAALGAVTAGRPTGWIGSLVLDQVVPEYAIAVIRDKASDMLRLTRVVATGRRWVTDLRTYLDRLVDIASAMPTQEWGIHAQRILRSEAPLFSLPDSAGGSFTAADLRQGMPEPLREFPNHYRHRLNAVLELGEVDPELRHGQLGWVVSPAHALADLSPWSAKAFGEAMAPILDRHMVEDGWYPKTQRIRAWSWDGVPARELIDWTAAARAHADEHVLNIRRLKARLADRWKDVADDIYQRLGEAIREYFPTLYLNRDTRRLEFHPDLLKPTRVELTHGHYGLLCDAVQVGEQAPADASERIATRIILYRLVSAARRRGVIGGPLPSRPLLSVTSDPSPFLPNLGLAVRQAEELRTRLLARSADGRGSEVAQLALMAVLTMSPYRRLLIAGAAVNAAAGAMRSQERPDCLRIPAVVEKEMVPLVFGGVAAMFLARRCVETPSGRSPAPERLAHWLRGELLSAWPLPADDTELLHHLESLFQAAGRLELSGPERVTLLRDSGLASVAVDRSIARDDNWPVRTALGIEQVGSEAKFPIVEDEPLPTAPDQPKAFDDRAVKTAYAQFARALNPESFPALAGASSDSHRGWRQKLKRMLESWQREQGATSNLGLLIGFTLHRLRHGGKRKKKNLKHSTLAWVTRFGSDLLAVAGHQAILDWDADAYALNYLAVLVGKPVTARRQALDAMIPFHKFLVDVHQAPDVPMAGLMAFAGDRVKFSDPGTLTANEILAVLQVLQQDLATEQARDDALPDAVRELALRELIFLILEASGIRPSSAYGLVLGDLVLLGPGRDFVRIHTSGGFGRAKTAASQGYVLLEGKVWEGARDRVLAWLDQEKMLLAGTPWWKAPVFASKAGSMRRFSRQYLTRRIDELLKWVTADRKAHTYWLRKNRITTRHDDVASLSRPMARDVHAAMTMSGHVLIQTPLESYVSDPAVALNRHMRDGRDTERSAVLAATHQVGSQLDMAWLRAGGAASTRRMAVVLDRLALRPMAPPEERRTEAPLPRRRQALMPRHIDGYARAMHRFAERNDVLLHSGLSARQAGVLDHLATRFATRMGVSPWPLPTLKKSAVLDPARPLDGTAALFALLDAEPTEDLTILAASFAQQPYLKLLHGADALMVLDGDGVLVAARRLLSATNVRLTIRDDSSGTNILVPLGGVDWMSHAAAFRWTMIIVWMHAALTQMIPATTPPTAAPA